MPVPLLRLTRLGEVEGWSMRKYLPINVINTKFHTTSRRVTNAYRLPVPLLAMAPRVPLPERPEPSEGPNPLSVPLLMPSAAPRYKLPVPLLATVPLLCTTPRVPFARTSGTALEVLTHCLSPS